MDFSFPSNTKDMLLYLWKIIDLPSIPLNDLLYTLSFELYRFSPQGAKSFINGRIKAKDLVKDESGNLSLSQTLETAFNNWQEERKRTILSNILEAKQSTHQVNNFQKDAGSGFKVLLNAFLDKGTINRAATVSNSAFSIDEFNPNKGTITVSVAGKKEDSYHINIDINNKTLHHNCQDFENRRAQDKKFCKHIAKLFLLLKEKNEKDTEYFLNEIAENISDWDFSA